MKINVFKNYVGKTHEIAMSHALRIPRNQFEKKGIDLIDSNKGVEVKGCLIHPECDDYKKNYVKWTLFYQELYWHTAYEGLPLYCALGTYEMSVPRRKLGMNDVQKLELFISRREFWVVQWDWTLNFPIAEGKHHIYRYLRPRPVTSTGIPHIPPVKETIEINKGLLHFTEGVDISVFES